MSDADALVVLSTAAALPAVEALVPVRQRYGERVLIVPADAAKRLRGVAEAAVTLPGGGDARPPADASEIERIGVDAWNARVASSGKRRPGEGLAWDAPGFDPP